jgi:hypothetical protein
MVQIALQRKAESAAAAHKCTICWVAKVRCCGPTRRFRLQPMLMLMRSEAPRFCVLLLLPLPTVWRQLLTHMYIYIKTHDTTAALHLPEAPFPHAAPRFRGVAPLQGQKQGGWFLYHLQTGMVKAHTHTYTHPKYLKLKCIPNK